VIRSLITLFVVLLIDQALKIYIKLNFHFGESVPIIKGFFELNFIENPGMAFGWELPFGDGKIILTLFRIVAVFVIAFYLKRVIKEGQHKGFVTCVSMVLAGAIGNIIDSAIYGRLFTGSSNHSSAHWANGLEHKAYGDFLKGDVVDMLHFTLEWPDWTQSMGLIGLVFPPVFNVADAAISIGVIWILIRQRSYFAKTKKREESSESVEDNAQTFESNSSETSTQSP